MGDLAQHVRGDEAGQLMLLDPFHELGADGPEVGMVGEGGKLEYYPGKKDHHKRVTTERPHPTGGSCPREGHGKGELIRILFSVYFGGFRG